MKRLLFLWLCLFALMVPTQAQTLKLEFGQDAQGLYLELENISNADLVLPYGTCGHLGWFSAVVYEPESGPLFNLPWDQTGEHSYKGIVLKPGELRRKYLALEFPPQKGKIRAVFSTPTNLPKPNFWVGKIRSDWLEL